MGNKAKRSKMSILAEAEELLFTLLPSIQRMPKIERIEGAPREMKNAAFSLISNFTIAYYHPEVRAEYLRALAGDYAKLQAAFTIALRQGLFVDSAKIAIAMRMERIEEGIGRWRSSLSPSRQESAQVGGQPQEARTSIKR